MTGAFDRAPSLLDRAKAKLAREGRPVTEVAGAYRIGRTPVTAQQIILAAFPRGE